ncbi:MAG: putative rane protein MmpL family [Marmoricola sp.]|nr:putative rane protein MmpL family [Marmoricola sp.]
MPSEIRHRVCTGSTNPVYTFRVEPDDPPELDGERPRAVARPVRAVLRVPKLTIALWIAIGAAGLLLLPGIGSVVARQDNGTLPLSSPSLQALKVMDDSFGSSRTGSVVFVVFEDTRALSGHDRAAYSDLVARLEARPSVVTEVQDVRTSPALQNVLVSRDDKATYLPVGLSGALGTEQSASQVTWVRSQAQAARAETRAGVHVYVTGAAAKLVDITSLATQAGFRVGIIAMILLFLILLGIYRRVVTVLVPLVTIGIATMCAMSVLSLAGDAGMRLSTYTESFCVAVVLGAGTDYSIFLISRFREEFARCGEVRAAVAVAVGRIGGALLASAGTVAISSLVLYFARLSIFSTIGPPIALAVTTTVLVALTATPALLLLLGTRIGPAPEPSVIDFWGRTGRYVAAKPGRILLVGAGVLLVMSASVPSIRLAYDDRPSDPNATESNRGVAALDRHFAPYVTQPDYVLIVSTHDMRNTRDLADIARASRDLARVSGVSSVSPSSTVMSQDVRPNAASRQFLSADGRIARIQVLGTTDPGRTAGIDRYADAGRRVSAALAGTGLSRSTVMLTGAAGGSSDLRHYFRGDARLVLIAVLLTVLLLMMIVLRALVAPLYLLASVILSYAAALGVTVFVFQLLLGQDIAFNVPVLSFVLLVAVGADYNILLMSRIRENTGSLTPAVVGRAVTATGPVITSAGIIFACTFLPMTTSSLASLAQLCFAVVVGLLLDTIVVRTLIVPSMAAVLGEANWWPARRSVRRTTIS